MAVIEEVSEAGGTLIMDNIKLKVKEQVRRRDSEVISALERHKKVVSESRAKGAIPHSVDLLLKK